jgi:hypothetical protein
METNARDNGFAERIALAAAKQNQDSPQDQQNETSTTMITEATDNIEVITEEDEALAATKQDQDSPMDKQHNIIKPVTKNPRILDQLRTLSINGEVEALRKQARDATFIVGRMALAGQITVFYAGPNTGKTLLIMRLVAKASANSTIGNHVYHINLDDTFEGQISKAELGIRHGFEMVIPTKFPNPQENFAKLVGWLVEEGTAGETVFILDTIKKFVDVMDKRASSNFMNTCRQLTSAGGSIIALAHINKNKDGDNKGVPAGTSDVLDDCDCAYVMDIIDEQKVEAGTKKTVEFRQEKSRGPVVKEALYSYIEYDDADYERMFYSIKLIDGNEADRIRADKALQYELEKDQDLIKEVTARLSGSGGMIQKELVDALTTSGLFPRRKVVECLKRWSCPPEEGGAWTMTKGAHNSSTYKLNQ